MIYLTIRLKLLGELSRDKLGQAYIVVCLGSPGPIEQIASRLSQSEVQVGGYGGPPARWVGGCVKVLVELCSVVQLILSAPNFSN